MCWHWMMIIILFFRRSGRATLSSWIHPHSSQQMQYCHCYRNVASWEEIEEEKDCLNNTRNEDSLSTAGKCSDENVAVLRRGESHITVTIVKLCVLLEAFSNAQATLNSTTTRRGMGERVSLLLHPRHVAVAVRSEYHKYPLFAKYFVSVGILKGQRGRWQQRGQN